MSRKIITIDCNYIKPQYASSYLLIDDNDPSQAQAAFIDNNTTHCVPQLLQTLKNQGLSPEQVRYVIVTHIHLDHAGGSSALMKACPNATWVAHPRAAKHGIDPEKLISSAKQIYGEERFKQLYGEIEPIPSERIQIAQNNDYLSFGQGPSLQFIHTRGHANHHMCIFEPETCSIFTGDSFGVYYPELQDQGLVILPSTSPTDFDYAEAILSLERILSTGAKQAYPTHYGVMPLINEAAAQLRIHLDSCQRVLEEARDSTLSGEELSQYCFKKNQAHYDAYFASQKIHFNPTQMSYLDLDFELNAQGLAHAAEKLRQKGPH